MSWYSDEWIETTVTHDYVLKHIQRGRQRSLSEPLAFGQGLTDLTYGDWIVTKGQRLFLILLDIGCSERIFDLVDRSVDDSDLPVRQGDLASLGLGNIKIARKFYARQFAYQVHSIRKGDHFDYEDDDIVPLNVLSGAKAFAGKSSATSFECVQDGPNRLTKWRISLNAEVQSERTDLVNYYRTTQKLRHPNISSIFATYTQNEQGYVLLSPCPDISLKSFLEEPPKSFKQMSKLDQLSMITQWIRCLLSATAYLHETGWAHQAIRPSNVYVTDDNKIFLGPHAAIGVQEDPTPALVKDIYQYGAPEQWEKQAPWVATTPSQSTLHSRSVSTPLSKLGQTSVRLPAPAVQNDASRINFTDPQKPQGYNNPVSGEGTPNSSPLKRDLRTSASFTNGFTYSAAMKRQSSLPANLGQPTNQTISDSQNLRLSAISVSTPFQSDMFSLSVVIIELLTLFASICRSSNRYTSSALHTHLGKSSRVSTPAFHSNISAVHMWLDSLVQLPEPNNSKTLPKLITRNFTTRRTSWINRNDLDCSRYLGILASLIQIVRRGIDTTPDQRLISGEGLAQMDEIMRTWGMSIESCACCSLNASVSNSTRKATQDSLVNSLSTVPTAGRSRSRQGSPTPSEETIDDSEAEPTLDPEYLLPALTYSPGPLITPITDLPSRLPTPPPKEYSPSPLASRKSNFKPRISPRIANTNAASEDALWLPPTPSSTLFHPTVYELAAGSWDSDTGKASQDNESLNSVDLFIFKHNDHVPLSAPIIRQEPVGVRNGRRHMSDNRHQHARKAKNEDSADTETVIIAFEDFELPRKSGNAVQRTPTRSRTAPVPRNRHPSGSYREKIGERRPSGSHRERARERRPSSSKSQRRKRGEVKGLRDQKRVAPDLRVRARSKEDGSYDRDAWWGLDWGKWRKGEAEWRPAVGEKRDDVRFW